MANRFLSACLLAAALAAAVSARPGLRLLRQVGAVDCFQDPSNAECASYTISDDVLTANISTLCTSMPDMDGCVLQTSCASSAAMASSSECSLFAIFQNLCEDMPMMNGCQGYNRLCASGTVVKQCLGEDETSPSMDMDMDMDMDMNMNVATAPAPTPAPAPAPTPAPTPSPEAEAGAESEWVDPYAPLTGCYLTPTLESCADFEIPENVLETNVTTLCTSMPDMTSCVTRSSCQSGSLSGDQCDLFIILAGVCADMPMMNGCQGYNRLCATGSVVEECLTAA